MKKLLIAVLLLPASAPGMDEIVGEWAVDAESCWESRLIFDIEGNHWVVVAKDGRWESLGVAEYRREVDLLIITHGDGEERVEIVVQERDRLVLRNPDSPLGALPTELVRCPTY